MQVDYCVEYKACTHVHTHTYTHLLIISSPVILALVKSFLLMKDIKM